MCEKQTALGKEKNVSGGKSQNRIGCGNWNHKNQPILLNPKLLSVEEKKQMELYRSDNVIQPFMRRTEFLTELGK